MQFLTQKGVKVIAQVQLAYPTTHAMLTYNNMVVKGESNSISTLSTQELARRGAEETEKWKQGHAYDPQYCFELLRRALVEESSDAFTHVYQMYEGQVRNWVHHHSSFIRTGEYADYFVNAAFQSFYFALRGAKFERFTTLATLLSYLKICVHTAIAQHLRNEKCGRTVSLDDHSGLVEFSDPGAAFEVAELWSHICRLLPNEQDRLLARCALAMQLKPREICRRHREHWSNEQVVSHALYRIRRILRSDPDLAARVMHV